MEAINNKNLEFYIKKVDDLVSSGANEEALEILNDILKIDPKNVYAVNNKGKDLHKTSGKKPIEGYLDIIYNNKPSIINYRLEYEDEKIYLVVCFATETQKILLSEQELTFGTRFYLVCDCGYKTNSLYLSKGIFACRKCNNLHYESTTINKNSKHGKFLYQQSQILKIITERESIGRIFYRSQYTRRFNRWLDLCNRAGLTNEVADAQKLIAAINNL